MSAIIRSSDFNEFLDSHATAKSGAFVDTNLLFAADYDSHRLHDEACDIADLLLARKIPIYANVTIRSELLELKRRVLITESLMDFLKQAGQSIPVALNNKLKSTQTTVDTEMTAGRHYFLSDQNIKSFRDLFEKEIGTNAWTKFCSTYLKTKLQQEWREQVVRKNITYLNESAKMQLPEPPNWEDAVAII